MIRDKKIVGRCTLILADCLEVLDTLPAIDAVISDPPYGMKLDVGLRKRTSRNKLCKTDFGWKEIHGDDKPFDPSPYLQYPKVILFGGNHYADKLPPSNSWIIWDKRRDTPPDFNSDCEMAWTNLKGVTRIYRQIWRGMIREGKENITNAHKAHPTQKPLQLMSWCLERAKIEQGDTVLDPYMGSGTTGVACQQAGVNFIGIEIDEDYYKIACKRIDEAARQKDLFIDAY